MTPEEIAKLDQSMKLIVDTFPPMWRSMYKSCIQEGFTESQAMDILKTYISTTLSPGSK